jgi:hypothetical protein
LQTFLVTAWHGADAAAMPPDIRTIYTGSALSKDPKRLNLFGFMLDYQGQRVHSFHGLPGGARGGDGRSDYTKEILNGLAKLKLPADQPAAKEGRPLAVPDLKATDADVPAGVRLFVRLNDPRDSFRSQMSVVEIVPMKAQEWKEFSFPDQAKEIEPEALRQWLVQLYPAGIRTADQRKPFTKITGSLKLEPAGTDPKGRYALLRGEVRLAKGDDQESAFEGRVEAVLTYGSHEAVVQSLRGVVQGDYFYRMRGTDRIPLIAVVGSRPE